VVPRNFRQQSFKLESGVLRSSAKYLPTKHPTRNLLQGTILALYPSINAIKSSTKRPYAQSQIGNLTVKSLFDTGADVSCLRTATFRRSKLNLQVQKDLGNNFKAAGGDSLVISGKIKLPITIDQKTVSHPFFLIDNLNEQCILGIDFISKHSLNYCPKTRTFFWPGERQWLEGIVSSIKTIMIPALSKKIVKVNVITDLQTSPANNTKISACIASETKPLLTSDLGLVTTNKHGETLMMVKNCAPVDVIINRNEIIGKAENLDGSQFVELKHNTFQHIESISITKCAPITPETTKFITSNAKISVPEIEKTKYLQLLQDHWETFSLKKHDLGLCKKLQHDIELKTKEPIYVKQFRIPEAHMSEVKSQLTEWLKLGVVEPCRSKYNSPIFVVSKKDGGLRIVQDFRALNTETYVDKYSMHDVNECVAEIGRSGSTIFSTLDLTSGFWQMQLKPEIKHATAFTIPGIGQFCWTVAPMGLLGSPASFQRLVEAVLAGIKGVIVYIDDLIVHSNTHAEHRRTLSQVFERLRANNLKVNLLKCEFGSKSVSYLGFRLTPEGIKPGLDKLKAVGHTLPPTCIREVRQFLGLCNFFRAHVKKFSIISHPLTVLTRKDCKWKRGTLPPEALKSFRELQSILCSEPVIDYPRRNRPYVLITDASFGDDKIPGGLGAILTQVDKGNEHKVIAYASRKLVKHEKNYTPFLLEMQAALWAMDHFHTYLKGNHFTLMTDHKPLETMGTIHTKTLNRLQEAMNTEFSFNIVYKKGSEMPADFLSRQAIDSIKWDNQSLKINQRSDPILEAIINYLYNRQVPSTTVMQSMVKIHANDCFMENDLLWRRLKRQGDTAHVVLFVPEAMKMDILTEAHGGQFTGHDGIFKTKERILMCYYWPGMDKDVNEFIKRCVRCQQRAKVTTRPHTELQPLPQCSAPNQRIHADLFGPLKTSGSGKKYILCITDAFTKYVELVALPDKEAETVSHAIFNRWICRYGSPLQVTTDGGKEFCAKLSDQLYKLMDIDHLTTSPYHPQCNSQVEIVNKTIAKYLSSFVDQTTLDWEIYLPPLMFSYNTSMHSTTKFTPYFLTFGQKARAPHFPSPDISRKFYGESTIDEMWMRLQKARQLAIQNNDIVRDDYEQKYNKNVIPTTFSVGQEVFLDEHNFLNKNRKLAPQFSGPHVIEKIIGKTNAQLRLKNGKSTIIHFNRIKPFLSQSDKLIEKPIDPPQQQVEILPVDFFSDEEEIDPLVNFSDNPNRNLLPTLPTPPIQNPTFLTQKKRGRGRPKKTFQEVPKQGEGLGESDETPPPTTKKTSDGPKFEPRTTRSQLKILSDQQKAEYFAVSFINVLKQLTVNKNKNKSDKSEKKQLTLSKNKNKSDKSEKTLKNKTKIKNGSSSSRWSKLQNQNFRTFGDIFGQGVNFTHSAHNLPELEDTSSSESEGEQPPETPPESEEEQPPPEDSEEEILLSESEHGDEHHSSSDGEEHHSSSDSDKGRQGDEHYSSAESDHGGNVRQDMENPEQRGHDQVQKEAEKAIGKMAEEERKVGIGIMLPMSNFQLPFIQGPQQPAIPGSDLENKPETGVSAPPVHVPKVKGMPTGTQLHPQDPVSPPPLPPKRTIGTKAAANRQTNLDKGHSRDPALQEMGKPTGTRPKTRQEPIPGASKPPDRSTKPTLTTKGFVKTPPASDKFLPGKSGAVGHLDQRLGNPKRTDSGKEGVRLDNMGHAGSSKPVSPMAGMRSNTQLPLSKPAPTTHPYRSKSGLLTKAEQEAKDRAQQEGRTKPPVSRPTRSNTVAPEIKPTTTPLERELAKAKKTNKK